MGCRLCQNSLFVRPVKIDRCLEIKRRVAVISAAICKMAMRAQLEEALYDALITTLTEHGVISGSDDSVGEERYHSFLVNIYDFY